MGEVADKEGRTVLFVSHNMAAIRKLCSQALIMHEGKSTVKMETHQAVDQYLNQLDAHDKFSHITHLENIEGRIRNGPLRFTKFYIEDEKCSKVKTLISGKKSRLVLEYKTFKTLSSINDVDVSIVIFDQEGVRIANLWNISTNGVPFANLPATGRFICTLPKLPFREGKYHLEVWCGVNGITSDWLEFAAHIVVEDGDYYGFGKLPKYSKGLVLLDHSWTIEDCKDATK